MSALRTALLLSLLPLALLPGRTLQAQPAQLPGSAIPALESVTSFPQESSNLTQLIHLHLQQLHSALPANASFDQHLLAEGLTRLYAANAYAPLWDKPERLAQLLHALSQLADDGLKPEDYRLAALQRLASPEPATAPTLDQQACHDLLATQVYLLALTHLAQGRLDPAQIEPYWQADTSPQFDKRNPELALQRALDGLALPDINTAFEQARPQFPLYQRLRQAYIQLRQRTGDGTHHQNIPEGPSIRPGMQDARIPLLRQRLGLPALEANSASAMLYDPALVEAVTQYQRDHALNADGIAGRATLAELNLSEAARLEQLRINLERARWLARATEPRMVLVDIAGARITYYRDNVPVWQSRVQVGTSARATPRIASQITHFTFNPTWTVPPTILRQDKLPRIRQDPDYLTRNRYRVLDTAGSELDPSAIDWNHPGAIMLRQDAGPGNALGQVAIRFPNQDAIYLHDTPSRNLFTREQRTFSSGCVRVENATDLVNLLIQDAGDLTPDAVQKRFDNRRTQNVKLTTPIPVLLAYWTADADENGKVRYRPDIYRRDARLGSALAQPPALLPLPCAPVQAGLAAQPALLSSTIQKNGV